MVREGGESTPGEEGVVGTHKRARGWLLSRHGPQSLPAVCSARCLLPPRQRNVAKWMRLRYHCRQTMARSHLLTFLGRGGVAPRRSHKSRSVSTPPDEVAGLPHNEVSEADALRAARQVPNPCLGPRNCLRRDAPLRRWPGRKAVAILAGSLSPSLPDTTRRPPEVRPTAFTAHPLDYCPDCLGP